MHHRPLNAHSPSHALCVNTASPRVATTVEMCTPLVGRTTSRLWLLVLLLYPALNCILCSSFTNTHIGQYRHPANPSPVSWLASHRTVCDLEAFWRETGGGSGREEISTSPNLEGISKRLHSPTLTACGESGDRGLGTGSHCIPATPQGGRDLCTLISETSVRGSDTCIGRRPASPRRPPRWPLWVF